LVNPSVDLRDSVPITSATIAMIKNIHLDI
jgi:hypothetical protein